MVKSHFNFEYWGNGVRPKIRITQNTYSRDAEDTILELAVNDREFSKLVHIDRYNRPTTREASTPDNEKSYELSFIDRKDSLNALRNELDRNEYVYDLEELKGFLKFTENLVKRRERKDAEGDPSGITTPQTEIHTSGFMSVNPEDLLMRDFNITTGNSDRQENMLMAGPEDFNTDIVQNDTTPRTYTYTPLGVDDCARPLDLGPLEVGHFRVSPRYDTDPEAQDITEQANAITDEGVRDVLAFIRQELQGYYQARQEILNNFLNTANSNSTQDGTAPDEEIMPF